MSELAIVQARHALTNRAPRRVVVLWELRAFHFNGGPRKRKRANGRNPITVAAAWNGNRWEPKWLLDLGVFLWNHAKMGATPAQLDTLAARWCAEQRFPRFPKSRGESLN